MADGVELSQQTISCYEAMDEIGESMLEKFARTLDVLLELLKMKTGKNVSLQFRIQILNCIYFYTLFQLYPLR